MNPSSLYEMRHSIVQAVSDYVDIEAEELVEVRPSFCCTSNLLIQHLHLSLLLPESLSLVKVRSLRLGSANTLVTWVC